MVNMSTAYPFSAVVRRVVVGFVIVGVERAELQMLMLVDKIFPELVGERISMIVDIISTDVGSKVVCDTVFFDNGKVVEMCKNVLFF